MALLTSIHSPIRASSKQNPKLHILPRLPHMMLTIMLLLMTAMHRALSATAPAPWPHQFHRGTATAAVVAITAYAGSTQPPPAAVMQRGRGIDAFYAARAVVVATAAAAAFQSTAGNEAAATAAACAVGLGEGHEAYLTAPSIVSMTDGLMDGGKVISAAMRRKRQTGTGIN